MVAPDVGDVETTGETGRRVLGAQCASRHGWSASRSAGVEVPREYRLSIPSTYDSRETGPRYHVTTRVGDYTIKFQDPVVDPFVNTTIHINWRDLLRGLIRGGLTTSVIVGADMDMIDDVLELDANILTPGASSRRDEFNASIHEAIRDLP